MSFLQQPSTVLSSVWKAWLRSINHCSQLLTQMCSGAFSGEITTSIARTESSKENHSLLLRIEKEPLFSLC